MFLIVSHIYALQWNTLFSLTLFSCLIVLYFLLSTLILYRHSFDTLYSKVIRITSYPNSYVPIWEKMALTTARQFICVTPISMAWSKTTITPLLTHWSYCSLALSHRYIPCYFYYGSLSFMIFNVWHKTSDCSWVQTKFVVELHWDSSSLVSFDQNTMTRTSKASAILMAFVDERPLYAT